MTDDEIMELAKDFAIEGELVGFARAIESRTLTNQKSRWYQVGVEAEREACAKLCDRLYRKEKAHASAYGSGYWCVTAKDCASAIRSRGE